MTAAPGSELQAYAMIALTVVLVGITGYYAYLTKRIASEAKNAAESAAYSARATERSALTAERGLILQAMPLVFGHKVKVKAAGGEHGRTEVTLFGFGQMPAFQVCVDVRQDDNKGYAGPLDHHDPTRGPRSIDLDAAFQLVDYDHPYDVEVTYQDALGTWYRTIRRSMRGGQSLSSVERLGNDDKWEMLVDGLSEQTSGP